MGLSARVDRLFQGQRHHLDNYREAFIASIEGMAREVAAELRLASAQHFEQEGKLPPTDIGKQIVLISKTLVEQNSETVKNNETLREAKCEIAKLSNMIEGYIKSNADGPERALQHLVETQENAVGLVNLKIFLFSALGFGTVEIIGGIFNWIGG